MNLTGIKIEGVTASRGRFTAVLTNMGDKTITNIHWTIAVDGGIFNHLHFSTTSSIASLDPNTQATFATGKAVRAFGPITITVTADYAKKLVINGRIFFNVVRLI